ncbi:hypothetical protein QZH41_006555 [Actinostola sp. cb2023]|nr:hypothetical protein QZH41_006555 [Actinostola sp. cb2023]
MSRTVNDSQVNSSQICYYLVDRTNVALSSTFSVVMAVLAIVGNVLVLLAIAKTPRLRTVTWYFISSLAFGDLYLNIVLIPMWVVKLDMNLWTLDNHPLQLAIEFLSVQMATSVAYNLGMVSIDRLVSIKYVYKYSQILTSKRCITVIIGIWVLSLVVSVPRLFLTDIKDISRLFFILAFVVIFVPYMVVIYCYVWIYKIAKCQAKKIAVNVFDRIHRERNRKGSITIGIVIGIYSLLGLPVVIVAIVDYIETALDPCKATKMRVYWMWALALSYSHSAYNPWIYALRNEVFNRAIRKILRLKSGRVISAYATSALRNLSSRTQ